jgi:segregation and condensation protein A
MPTLKELVLAFRDVMERSALFSHHQISREPLSVRERMSQILSRISRGPARFVDLVDPGEGRAGVVVCFLAVLELAKSALIAVQQDAPFQPMLLMPPQAMPAMQQEAVDE